MQLMGREHLRPEGDSVFLGPLYTQPVWVGHPWLILLRNTLTDKSVAFLSDSKSGQIDQDHELYVLLALRLFLKGGLEKGWQTQ